MSGVPTGLDFGAVMAIAEAQGADMPMLVETIAEFESALLAGMADDEGED